MHSTVSTLFSCFRNAACVHCIDFWPTNGLWSVDGEILRQEWLQTEDWLEALKAAGKVWGCSQRHTQDILVHGGLQSWYEKLGLSRWRGWWCPGHLKKRLGGVSSLLATPSCTQWKHLCVLEGISHSGGETPMSSLWDPFFHLSILMILNPHLHLHTKCFLKFGSLAFGVYLFYRRQTLLHYKVVFTFAFLCLWQGLAHSRYFTGIWRAQGRRLQNCLALSLNVENRSPKFFEDSPSHAGASTPRSFYLSVHSANPPSLWPCPRPALSVLLHQLVLLLRWARHPLPLELRDRSW